MTTNPTPAPLSPEREAAARQQIADLIYDTYGQFDHHRTSAIADAVMPAVRAAVAAELDRVRAERDELKKRVAELEAIGREAATALDELIEYCDDPGTANLGTRFRLKQALIGSQPHCPAEYGGPGYTHCELPAGHDGQHESVIGNMRRATWGGEFDE